MDLFALLFVESECYLEETYSSDAVVVPVFEDFSKAQTYLSTQIDPKYRSWLRVSEVDAEALARTSERTNKRTLLELRRPS